MSMRISLSMSLPLELYATEETRQARAEADRAGGEVYAWQTAGRSNWLQKGWHIADVLGFVVLPAGLPETIDMPDDPA